MFSVLSRLCFAMSGLRGMALLVTAPLIYGQAEITPDANTVVLDHFNGSTIGVTRGPVSFTPGLPGLGQAVNLGSNAFIDYKLTTPDLRTGTIEMWIYPRQYNASILNINWREGGLSYPNDGHIFHLRLTSVGKVESYRCAGWGGGGVPSKAAVPLNQWTHIALSFGQQRKMYINGELDSTYDSRFPGECGIPDWSPNSGAYLNYYGSSDFGLVDELHISKIQRSDDQIRSRICGTGLTVFAVFPSSGGNAGSATPLLRGCQIATGAAARLTGVGVPDIVATQVVVSPFGTTASPTFDLQGATPGPRNLKITNPDGTFITISNGFAVEQGGFSQIWTDVLGFPTLRAGNPQSYTVIYGNRGNIDAPAAHIWVSFPSALLWTIESGPKPTASETLNNGQVLIGFDVVPVSAGSTGTIQLTLRAPLSFSTAFQLRVWTNQP